jgi:hypothetical protein
MTFITAIRSAGGIIVAADSLEIQTGAYMRWNEFKLLLESKDVDEKETQVLLSPFEVASHFKSERIKNISGAQKIFSVHRKALLLVAGKAELNKKPFAQIANEAETLLESEPEADAEKIKQVVFDILKRELDKEIQESVVNQCEYILAVRDSGKNYVFLMRYYTNFATNQQLEFGPGVGSNQEIIVTMGGSAGAALSAGRFFNSTYTTPSPTKAFELAKALTSLAVLTEEITQEIPGIGATIYYMFLHDNGSTYISSETDMLNSLM